MDNEFHKIYSLQKKVNNKLRKNRKKKFENSEFGPVGYPYFCCPRKKRSSEATGIRKRQKWGPRWTPNYPKKPGHKIT